MANPNLTRIHQKIFSENATNNGQFGSLEAGTRVENPNIATLQALPAYQEGWSDAVISGEELPSLEEFNGLHKIETEQLQYLLNKGIPEYSADAEYYIGDIQREVGGTKLYKSITNNNIGNALTDIANWQELGDLADLIGLNQATTTASGFSLLPNQITIENDSGDTAHDILFNAGNFNFDDGSGQAILSSNLIKRIDAAWVAGNNQGGLFSGTAAGNATYHIFVISNDDGSLVDAGFSNDINAADIPTGYTKKRRIASLLTDPSSNIRNGKYIFNRDGSYNFTYNNSILAIGGSGNFPLTLTNLSIGTPFGIKTSPSFDCLIRSTGSDGIAIADFDTQTEFKIASSSNSQNTGSLASGALFTNLNSQIKYRNSGNDTFVDFNFDINVCGWFDNNL